VPFRASPTVFAAPVVAGFTASLRRLRIFVRDGMDGERLAAAAKERLG
jgi:hypothetical protein